MEYTKLTEGEDKLEIAIYGASLPPTNLKENKRTRFSSRNKCAIS